MLVAVSRSLEGRFAIVTDRGAWDAVAASGRSARAWSGKVRQRFSGQDHAQDARGRTSWCGRSSRVVPTPRRWCLVGDDADDGGKQARSPGRARSSREDHRAGKAGCIGQSCGDCRLLFLLQAGHGCGLHPAFPAPSSLKRASKSKARTRKRAARLRSRAVRSEIAAGHGAPFGTELLRNLRLRCFGWDAENQASAS